MRLFDSEALSCKPLSVNCYLILGGISVPDQFNRNGNGDVYSLESILSEYKGRAFVQGKSKLSKEELEEQARHILEEYMKPQPEEPEEEPALPETAAKEPAGEEPPAAEIVEEESADEPEAEEAATPLGEETLSARERRGLFRRSREPKPPKADKTPEKEKGPKTEKPSKPEKGKKPRREWSAAPGEEKGLVSEWIKAYGQAEDEPEDVRIYEPAFMKKRREQPQPEEAEQTTAEEGNAEASEAAQDPTAPVRKRPEEASSLDELSSVWAAESAEKAPADAAAPQTDELPAASEQETAASPASSGEEPAPTVPAAPTRAKKQKPRRGELRRKSADRSREIVPKQAIEKGLRQVEKRLERIAEVEEKEERLFSYRQMSEDEQAFFGVGRFSEEADEQAAAEEARRTREKQERRRARAQAHRRAAEARAAKEDAAEAARRELSAGEAVRVYGSGTKALRARLLPQAVLCLLMIVLTMMPELGLTLPGALGENSLRVGALFILLLLSVFFGLDVFSTGLTRPLHGHFCQETLVTASVLLALLDAALQYFSADRAYGMPFCAVAGVSLFFASLGTLRGRRAFNLTFRMADRAKVPTVLSAEWEKVDEGHVISKNVGAVRGFVTRGTDQDPAESLYAWLAPLLLLLCVLLAFLCSAATGENSAFFHILSAFSAVCAAFDLLLIFNRPFLNTASELFDHGAALAGWNGALDMDKAVGMVLRDADLFPENCLRLSGLKIFSHFPEERIVSYTGSLIVASGIGTTRVFSELMREYGCDLYRVEELECYESGGIGANINGSQVLVGSAAFMNLMGIRLPPNLELRSAVFSAIDSELAGVFIISYTPSDAVQAALVDMLQARIRPIFALRDFLLTPSLLSGKFKITLEEGEFLTYASRFELSENNADPAEEPTALMSREGIGHYVETVRGGRRLCRSTRVALALTLLGTGLGLALLVLVLLQGAFGAASAGNVLLFMLLWELAVWIFSGF